MSYAYDPLGRRVKKDVDGAVTLYLSDGVEEALELSASGAVQRRYVYGPGVDEPIVMWEGSGVANFNRRFYRADHQGSIVALTGHTGALVESYSYDAYGAPDNAGGQPIRYTGRRWDAETGLYYYRARYYSPALGRFLQTDPVGYGDNTNLYSYVGNDPVNGTDPTGEFANFIIGAVIGATIEVIDQVASGSSLKDAVFSKQTLKGAVLGAVGGGIAGAVSKKILAVTASNIARTGQGAGGTALKVTNQVAADATGGGVGAAVSEVTGQLTENGGDLSQVNVKDVAGATLTGIVVGGTASAFAQGVNAATQKVLGVVTKPETAAAVGGAAGRATEGATEVAAGTCGKEKLGCK